VLENLKLGEVNPACMDYQGGASGLRSGQDQP